MQNLKLGSLAGILLGFGIMMGSAPQGLSLPKLWISQSISSQEVPVEVEDRLVEGMGQGMQGHYPEAIRIFSRLIQEYPNYADAYHNRGIAQAKLGNKKAAIADQQQAVRMNTELAEAHQALGLLLLDEGNKDQGIEHLQIAAQLYQKQGNKIAHNRVTKQLQSLQP